MTGQWSFYVAVMMALMVCGGWTMPAASPTVSDTNPGVQADVAVPAATHSSILEYSVLALGLRPAECSTSYGTGVRMFTCASHSKENVLDWPCIRAIDLCNGVPDCPNAEDENPTLCLFHLAERDLLSDLVGALERIRNLLVPEPATTNEQDVFGAPVRYSSLPQYRQAADKRKLPDSSIHQ